MVHRCPDLEQYAQFLELVEEAKAAGQAEPLTWAIQEAVRRNILRDYLERRGGETLSILMAEYDYATDLAVQKEEAYEDGLFAGAYQNKLETARSLLAYGDAPEKVALCTGLSLEIVQQLAPEAPSPSTQKGSPAFPPGSPS